MRTTTSFRQMAAIALSLSTASSALSWPRWLPDMDSLVVRQQQSITSAAPTQTVSDKPTTTNANSGDKPTVSQTNLNTGAVATGQDSGSGKSTTAAPTHTLFNPVDRAGGVTMVTPAPSLGSQYYKIGDPITWGWNYTDLQATPTAVDVLISCSSPLNIHTLTQNMTFETAGNHFTWNAGSYQQTAAANPLQNAMYTLVIYDSDSAVTANAEAGYLAPFNRFSFGLYSPKAPTPLNQFVCAICTSGAVSETERRAIGLAIATSIVTMLSFTWFVTGLGMFA